MKKIGIITSLLLVVTIVSAQSYQELMNQAKNAEQNNKLVTALGIYYDAAHANNAEPEAEKRFAEIKYALESGKPDLSQDEDIFTLNEKWIDLRKDFINYFTNNCPWTFYFNNDFESVKLNAENKTADYKIYYLSRVSRKYILIDDIVNKGSPKDAKNAIPLTGMEVSIKELTDARTWSKEWYDTLDKKVEELNCKLPYKYYFGQKYKYGSKEQQYFYSVVNKTNFSTNDPTLEDFLKVVNDYEAYQWRDPSVYPLESIGLYVTIGLYDGDTLIYEIPDIFLEGYSLDRSKESMNYGINPEYIKEEKNYCKSITLSNIPQNIVNKIEKKAIQYKIIKSFIPYGFYAYTNNSNIIPMKMGQIGDLKWEQPYHGSYSYVSAKNLDKKYKAYERLSDNREYYIDVYKTNVFGEITYILHIERRNYDKRDAKKIVSELATQDWELLKDYTEDYFKRDFYKEHPELIKYTWTEEELNNKKAKGERELVFKRKYKE